MKEWDFEETAPEQSKLWGMLGFTLENLRRADAKHVPIEEIDFTDQIKKMKADEKAGYPPKCNPGYKVSPDKKKCIPTEEGDAGWKKKKTK